jgi:hypothetical protein
MERRRALAEGPAALVGGGTVAQEGHHDPAPARRDPGAPARTGGVADVSPLPLRGRPTRRTVAEAGYVEEEHLLRGTADLYGYDAEGRTVVVAGERPFTTRAVVRRPADPARATGDVVLEPLHPAGDMASSWPRVGRTILRDGWTWIGLTQDVFGMEATRRSDPERYGALSLARAGLGFDVMARWASWLRAEELPGVRVDHLFMTGASHTGSFQRVFLGDGFHARARRPDGGPAVEGYLIQISSGGFWLGGYHPLNDGSARPPLDDRRRVIGDHDVPVIELLSEGEAETNRDARRPDADRPDSRYRLYEVPGSCHMSPGEPDTLLAGRATVEEPSDFPMWALAGGALANLRRWAVTGEAPPTAERIALHDHPGDGPCGTAPEALPARRDEHGNALGGVRTPCLDVPVARYYPHATLLEPTPVGPPGRPAVDAGQLLGIMERFPPDELRRLHGTVADYRRRFDEGVAALVAEGWILPPDADGMIAQAAAIEF